MTLTTPLTTPLTTAQRTVATHGLPDAPGSSVEVTDDELRELIGWAGRERLDGLLWGALSTGAFRPVDDEHDPLLVKQASDTHLGGLRSSLAAEATAVTAVEVLAEAGVEAVVFKGLANAHLDHDRPEHRTFFDADLLVARPDFATAIATLLTADFARAAPPIRERWEQRFARAAELRSPGGTEVDLHASITTGYFGERLDHSLLRDDPGSVRLGGRDLRTLGPAGRLLTSSYAIVLSRGPNIRLMRDLAQQLLVTGADWQQAARLAGDGDIVVARGLIETARQLGVHHDAVDWARGIAPTERAARALTYADDALHEGWSADARSTMLALGPAQRLRFLAGVVLPSRASLHARGRTITGHLVRDRSRSDPAGTDADTGRSTGQTSIQDR